MSDPNNYAAALYLYAADLTLEQTSSSSVTAVGGELATSPIVTGTTDLTFTATDPGSGVYEALVTADGHLIQTTVLDEAGGRCRNVGQTTDGLPAFLYLQPCPASVSANLPVEVAALSPGTHHLVVSVIDAAGNSASVLDRTITVAWPPGASNGTPASSSAIMTARWRGATSSRVTAPFDRQESIVGRLTTPGGVPIVNARVAYSSTPAVAGAATSAAKTAVTAVDGSFVIQLGRDISSRKVELTYTAHPGEAPAATTVLLLSVRAPVSMTISPRDAASEGTIHFHGRLAGGPLPKGGKPVILEARSGRGAWIEFRVIRAGKHGRFASAYHFKFPGPARYQFRAVCEQEADYPFATGSSRTVDVTER